MKQIDPILTETSDPAQTQNLGAADSPGHSIRDRSAKQRGTTLASRAATAAKSFPVHSDTGVQCLAARALRRRQR